MNGSNSNQQELLIPTGSSPTLANEINRKRYMHLIMTICGITVLLAMGILALINGNSILFISDIVIAVTLAYLLYRVRKDDRVDPFIILTLVIVMLFFLYLFLTWKADGLSFFWFYAYPIVALFMLGCRKGLILSLAFIILSFLLYFALSFFEYVPTYPEGILLRIFLSYLLVTFLTFVFEKTRSESQNLLKLTMKELREEAIRDGLTGLYNRRYLDEIWALLRRCQHESPQIATFIMIDIDFFKHYNDTYGHQMGDDVLIRFSRLLSDLIRRKTDYVFRYGGEEFSLLLYGADHKKSVKICEEIQEGLAQLNIPHSASSFGRVTVSLGAAICGLDRNTNEIIKIADDALYKAKQTGRNRLVFDKRL